MTGQNSQIERELADFGSSVQRQPTLIGVIQGPSSAKPSIGNPEDLLGGMEMTKMYELFKFSVRPMKIVSKLAMSLYTVFILVNIIMEVLSQRFHE
eukprot:CAMPEP_0181327008 /NCGR_PEP_ID=MMETSP1101-20121128/21841_1 /TAXON_ID=46948 /ORGANISM="Rhodomonas abbreviata, Strain Caron Lab Isolate" /LENGTH=95 /DNA_ID=CAMNT_0023435577 /DNA_START=188 /DNA_END=475 /DNA_ORIENTATION=+